MDLHNLTPADNSVRKGKRIARGQGSGKGGTATRGHKGAQSRSGYKRKKGFEGGQMPLQRRVPKRGFKNHNRVAFKVFNLDQLQALSEKHSISQITPEVLCANGLANKNDKIKILGRGELTSKLDVTVHAASESANTAVTGKGGTITII